MKYHCSILFFVALLTSTVLFGQNFRYTFYDGDQTPFKKVNQTLEDNKGFIWIASDNGLYRFDGQNFQDFNLSLKSRHIRSIVSKNQDTVVFSNDSGIFKLYYEEDNAIIVPLAAIGEGTEIGYADHLFIDSKKHLWVNSPEVGIVKIDSNGTILDKYPLPKRHDHIFFGEDGNQTLWALASNGSLFIFDSSINTFINILRSGDVRHFFVGEDYLFLVGAKIERYSIKSGNILKKQNEIISADLVFDQIGRDLAGTFFVASGESLFTILEDGNSLQKVFGSNDPHRVEELPFQKINSIGFSSDQLRKGGKIWVGSSTGLGLLQTNYFKAVDGMPHDNVFSIATGIDHKVLISQGNLFQVDVNKNTKSFSTISGADRVTGMGVYDKKSYYGTANAEIVVFEKQQRRHTYDLDKRGGGVFFMSADAFGDIWFCQAPSDKPLRGVGKLLSNGQLKFYGADEGLNSRILVVREGGRSEIYAAGIGADSYLFKYDRKADAFESKSLPLPPDVSTNFEVHDLSIDSLGIVWMGTTDGLLKYDTETVKRVDLGPFTSNEIRAVHALGNSGVWMATDTDGLIYLYPSGHYVQFDEESGTPSKIASYRCLSMDENGTLWVGTAEGAVHSTLVWPKPLAAAPPRITSVHIDNNPVDFSGLSLSNKEEVQFGLATISYPAKGIQYQYKMVSRSLSEEASEHAQWSAPFREPSMRLSDLTSGQYTLFIRAKRPGGYGWSDPISIPMVVKKAWYTTWWGTGLLLVMGMIAFWYITYRWGRSKAKNLSSALSQKQKALEDKQAQLTAKSDALAHREKELKSTGTNLYMLNRLLLQLPKNEPWEKVLPVLKKLVTLPTGLDAFEIGFVKTNEVHFKGYGRKGALYHERKEEFNEKENLQSYALSADTPLLINDHETEAIQYIGRKDPKDHASLLLVPFKQLDGADAIFCAYAKEKERFSHRDLTLIQVLVKFLSMTVTNQSNST